MVYVLVFLNLPAIFEVPQIIEAKHITVTHSGDMLNFIFESLVLWLPNVFVFPVIEFAIGLLEILLAIHIEIHLVL